MDKTTRSLSKEVLERIEEGATGWHNGNQVLEACITYRKDARTRGYYLRVTTYRELDNGGTMFDIFGSPRKDGLLEEAKMFSAKKLASLVVAPALLASCIEEVKAAYWAAKAIKDQDTRTRAQRDAAAFAHEHPAQVN